MRGRHPGAERGPRSNGAGAAAWLIDFGAALDVSHGRSEVYLQANPAGDVRYWPPAVWVRVGAGDG